MDIKMPPRDYKGFIAWWIDQKYAGDWKSAAFDCGVELTNLKRRFHPDYCKEHDKKPHNINISVFTYYANKLGIPAKALDIAHVRFADDEGKPL